MAICSRLVQDLHMRMVYLIVGKYVLMGFHNLQFKMEAYLFNGLIICTPSDDGIIPRVCCFCFLKHNLI